MPMSSYPDSGPAGRCLVVCDGGLAALVATAIATEETVRRENLAGAEPPVLWAAVGDEAGLVRRHAEAFGAAVADAPALTREPGEPGGTFESRVLLRAGVLALGAKCRRVIWPMQPPGAGPDEPAPVETVAAAVDRATLVSRLLSLDAEGAGLPEVAVEVPFVDLSDQQLAELACELGVRAEDCWWWASDAPAAARERERWGRVLPTPA